MNCKLAAVNGTITALFIVIYSLIGYWLDHFLSLSLHVTRSTHYIRAISSDMKSLTEGRNLGTICCCFLHNTDVFWDILCIVQVAAITMVILWSKSNYSLSVLSSSPLSLLAHQFYYHHLLCCVSLWRLLCSGHLRDDLRHGLLRYLHDGYGQAVHNGQLDVECECSTWFTTWCHTYTVCVLVA